MRILVLSNRYPPYIKGGYEVMCYELSEGLKARGHKVEVLTGLYGVDRPVQEGHIHRLLHRFDDSYDIVQRTRWEQEDNKSLRRRLREFKPDAIFIWNLEELFFSLNLTAKEAGVPIFYSIADIWLLRWLAIHREWREFWQRPGNSFIKRLVKAAMRRYFTLRDAAWMRPIDLHDIDSRHLIFVSDYRKQQHIRAGFAADAAPVIYNGIDVSRFRASKRNPASRVVRFLYAGRLEESKGAHVALEAAELLTSRGCHDWALSIYGVPENPLEYVRRMKEKVRSNGLNERVRFCEPVSNERMSEVYAEHDVLIFPSIGPEGFSVTLVEAMASGLAVVGTTTGGSAEILRHEENSLTFAAGDAQELAAHLERLIADGELRARLAASATALVHERFTVEKMVTETEDYMVQALDKFKVR